MSAGLVLAMLWMFYRLCFQYLLPTLFQNRSVDDNVQVEIKRILIILIIAGALFGGMRSLGLDFDMIPGESYTLFFTTLLKGIVFILLARELDILMSSILKSSGDKQQSPTEGRRDFKAEEKRSPSLTIQTAVVIFIIIFILKNFNWDAVLLSFQDGKVSLNISDLLLAILIFIFARLFAWLITQVAMHPYYQKSKVDVGTQYAVNQLMTYVIFVIAFFVAVESLGVQFAWLWGGAAALLVGVGLGLQQTFNDLTSGIILLFERSIEVGNVVDLDGTVGIVRKIGLRTSLVETRDNIIILVPNSQFIVDQVVNWSHFDDKARFEVNISVAYGSDTDKVKKLLLQVAKENAFVLEHPSPSVLFGGFGDSSLDFKLYFWSRNFMFIERVKSDIRFDVDKVFRENDVTIPFPQRDLWFKSDYKKDDSEE